MYDLNYTMLTILSFVALIFSSIIFLAKRYKRCPSDKVLVIFGSVGKDQAARCIHGGGTFVLPLIQDYSYLSLTPMTMNIPLQNALSLQNIRIHVPSTFTVGISTEQHVMMNAAERLLGLAPAAIEEMAKEIIFGQLRLTVASLTIEQINQDRERFLEEIRRNVEPELNKIGLYLINVNITDITDESDYISSIGKKAASEAINRAMVDVAEQDKLGAIGQSNAHRERDIRVAENIAESTKGKKKAESEERVYIQIQEALAVEGENESRARIAGSNAIAANKALVIVAEQEKLSAIGQSNAHRERDILIAENIAESTKGKKKAEAEQRVYVQVQEALAVEGENESRARIAGSNAILEQKHAEALRITEVARKNAEIEIQKAHYEAELARLKAEEIVGRQIEKEKIEILAQAEASKIRTEAQASADAVLLKYEAEAKGVESLLESKAKGYKLLINSCEGDAKAAATLLMIEKMEEIVKTQVEAIKNLKIDKLTVWDSGNSSEKNGSTTSNFISSLVKSLPPIHDVAAMAGIDLPNFLGHIKENKNNISDV